MNTHQYQIEQRVLAALKSVLPPGTPITPAGLSDSEIDVIIAGQPTTVKWVDGSDLGRVRAAIQLGAPDLLVARRMSPASRKLAHGARVGWLDESGEAEFAFGNVVVVRLNGSPDSGPRHGDPSALSSWTSAVISAAEAVLSGVPATVSGMTDNADMPASTASLALRYLQQEKLLVARAGRGPDAGRRVRDHDVLLGAYADAVAASRPRAEIRVGVLWRDPLADLENLGLQLHRKNIRWAATGALSAALSAPFGTQIAPLGMYVDARSVGALRYIAEDCGLPIEAAGRLTIRAFPSRVTLALREEIAPGMWSVTWPRAYADLRTGGVRGEEIAEHYRETAGSTP